MEDKVSIETQANELGILEEKLKIQSRAKNGASWFYWIAGLSLLNSVIFIVGGSLNFIFGLAVTQVIDGILYAIGQEIGIDGFSILSLFALFLDLIAAGLFFVVGYFARKGNKSAYIFGMILYGLDGLLVLLFQDWFGLLFHGLVFVGLVGGFQALRTLQSISNSAHSIEQLQNALKIEKNKGY